MKIAGQQRLTLAAFYIFLLSNLLSLCSFVVHSFSAPARIRRRAGLGTLNAFAPPAQSKTTESIWKFRGHDIYTLVEAPQTIPSLFSLSSKPDVLLIHGFGCSTTYWRATQRALVSAGFKVHAIDLLGQGRSAKPGREQEIEYSIALWADQCESYIRENIPDKKNVVLVGNSLGSLVALSAVTGDFAVEVGREKTSTNLEKRVKGIGMFNCGVGLNSKGIANEPQFSEFQRFLIKSVYDLLLGSFFKNKALLSYVLNDVVTKDLLRETLQSLYRKNPDRVDDELVDSFYYPAKDDGSVEALSQIYLNEPGASPFDLHSNYGNILDRLPLHLIWGDDDAVTPIQGGVGQFYLNLARDDSTKVSLDVIEQCGHVPFDDSHIESNESLLRWLNRIQ